MAYNTNLTYEERDYAIMAFHIFNALCVRDRQDMEAGNLPAWKDITELAEHVRAFDNRIDIAYLAETTLLDERGFIERDPNNQNVRLTRVGRENCGRGIDIPRSTNTLRINL